MEDKKTYYYEDEVVSVEDLGNDVVIVTTKTESGLELKKKMTRARYDYFKADTKEDSDPTQKMNAFYAEVLYPELREIIKKYGLTYQEFELYLLTWSKADYQNELYEGVSKIVSGDDRLFVPSTNPISLMSLLDLPEKE